MKGVIFLFVMGFSLSGNSQTKSVSNPVLTGKIVKTFNVMRKFEGLFEKIQSEEIEDSVKKLDAYLVSLFSDSVFISLNKSDSLTIIRSTDIMITTSQDKKMTVFSWRVFINQPSQQYSNVSWIRINKSACLFRNLDKGFDLEVQVDAIRDVVFNSKVLYIVTGSIRCGNLCIIEEALVFSIQKDGLISCKKCLFDGVKYFDKVEFNYVLSDEIKDEPRFLIRNKQLVSPRINEQGTKIIGKKEFAILDNNQ
jgi:hypothetical protein